MIPKPTLIGVALLAAGAIAFYLVREPSPNLSQAPSTSVIGTFSPPASLPGANHRDGPPTAGASAATERMANPLQRAADLRTIYEQFKGSNNALERNIAYRAWSACFPTFIAPQGQAIPIEEITRALPPNDANNGRRIDAYRGLLGRCKRFSDMPREQILSETQTQKNAWLTGAAQSPGDSAAKSHMAGNSGEALEIARAAVASKDPYAVDSLREFVIHYWWDHNDNHPDQLIDHPDLRALAFSVAACQMGLECGPASLTALQQCANTGECTGTVVDRYLQALPNQADRDSLLKESQRVVDAIRAGDYQALGLQ